MKNCDFIFSQPDKWSTKKMVWTYAGADRTFATQEQAMASRKSELIGYGICPDCGGELDRRPKNWAINHQCAACGAIFTTANMGMIETALRSAGVKLGAENPRDAAEKVARLYGFESRSYPLGGERD